jgi:chemotaxis protein MotA
MLATTASYPRKRKSCSEFAGQVDIDGDLFPLLITACASMDFASVIGLLLAAACLGAAVLLGGGSLAPLFDLPSLLITLGGSLAAVLIMHPLNHLALLPAALKKIFRRAPGMKALVEKLVELTELSRRDGLLSLESQLGDLDDRFLVMGMQMAVDALPPEQIEAVLRTEMETRHAANRDAKAIFDQLGRMTPAFGMIGTLLGLTMMLGKLNDPAALGPGLAVAMLTTLYGAVLANVVCLPCAEKLAHHDRQEMLACEIVLRGVLGVRDGINPRLADQQLSAFVETSKAA